MSDDDDECPRCGESLDEDNDPVVCATCKAKCCELCSLDGQCPECNPS